MCVCVCVFRPANVPRPALQNPPGFLHCLREEEHYAALQRHSQELQPDAATQVNNLCYLSAEKKKAEGMLLYESH